MSNSKWVQDFFDSDMTTEQRKVADRLAGYVDDEMKLVYDEIEEKVDEVEYPQGRYQVLADLVNSAIMCEKEKLKREIIESKNVITGRGKLNNRISNTAKKLIHLLDKRENMMEDGHLTSKACTDPIDLIRIAGMCMTPVDRRVFFKRNIAPILGMDNPLLNSATVNGDMPTLQEVLKVLNTEISTKPIEGRNHTIDVLLSSRKAKQAPDFERVFLYLLNVSVFVGYLPDDFSLTPETLATISRCSLGTGEYSVTDDAV
jgi:hypothetical protein